MRKQTYQMTSCRFQVRSLSRSHGVFLCCCFLCCNVCPTNSWLSPLLIFFRRPTRCSIPLCLGLYNGRYTLLWVKGKGEGRRRRGGGVIIWTLQMSVGLEALGSINPKIYQSKDLSTEIYRPWDVSTCTRFVKDYSA